MIRSRRPLAALARTSLVLPLFGLGAMALACSPAPGTEGALGSDDGSEGRTASLAIDGQTIPIHYELVNGEPRWQGDIDLQPAKLRATGEVTPDSFTVGTHAAAYAAGELWANQVLQYRFDSSISAAYQTMIQQAVVDWNAQTGFTFSQDSAQKASDYLLFVSDSSGCHSGIGRSPGANVIHVQDPTVTGFGCYGPQIVHEIGHAVGLLHEMTRPDALSYLTIDWSNICSGQPSVDGGEQCAGNDKRSQFQDTIASATTVGPFDFTSIMLYPSYTGDPTFAVNTALPILTLLDGGAYPNPQALEALSTGDVAGVRALYGLTGPFLSEYNGYAGDSITITGVNVSTAAYQTTFNFGSAPTQPYAGCASTTSCSVGVPIGSGTVPISVTVNGVTTSTGLFFTYDVPTVTGLSPSSGATVGGASVNLYGHGIVEGMAVNFGSSTVYAVCGTNGCAAQSPAGAAGTVHVTVSIGGMTSVPSSADQFTYVYEPVPTAVTLAGGLWTSDSATATVTLNEAATGVTTVNLAAIDPTTNAPAVGVTLSTSSLSFTSGQTQASFKITTAAQTASQVEIVATNAWGSANGGSWMIHTGNLYVLPPKALLASSTGSASVLVRNPGGTLTVSSSSAQLAALSPIAITAANDPATVSLNVGAVTSVSSATLTFAYEGNTTTAVVTLDPAIHVPPPPPPHCVGLCQ